MYASFMTSIVKYFSISGISSPVMVRRLKATLNPMVS
jgi:hypothetical protein